MTLLEEVSDLLYRGLGAEMSAIEFNDPLPELWDAIYREIDAKTQHLSADELRTLHDLARQDAYGRVMATLRAKGLPADSRPT